MDIQFSSKQADYPGMVKSEQQLKLQGYEHIRVQPDGEHKVVGRLELKLIENGAFYGTYAYIGQSGDTYVENYKVPLSDWGIKPYGLNSPPGYMNMFNTQEYIVPV